MEASNVMWYDFSSRDIKKKVNCGATKGAEIYISRHLAPKLIGRYIIMGEGSILVKKSNYQRFIGRDAMLRSRISCKNPEYIGICEFCKGIN